MNDDPVIEAERYELREAPRYRFDVDRRTFFKTLGGGIVVLLLVDAALAQETGVRRRGGGRGGQRPAELAAWLHIGEDGTVTVFTGKVEVGQNIRTSLTQASSMNSGSSPNRPRTATEPLALIDMIVSHQS